MLERSQRIRISDNPSYEIDFSKQADELHRRTRLGTKDHLIETAVMTLHLHVRRILVAFNSSRLRT